MANKLSDSPIKKRSVLYIHNKGVYRFLGWALTTTSLGTMAEPFQINGRHVPGNNFAEHDPSDPISRIDELRNVELGSEKFLMGGFSEGVVSGGDLLPRTFLKTGSFA